jgi:hypothetical protein
MFNILDKAIKILLLKPPLIRGVGGILLVSTNIPNKQSHPEH